jgi:hypothetical protein
MRLEHAGAKEHIAVTMFGGLAVHEFCSNKVKIHVVTHHALARIP